MLPPTNWAVKIPVVIAMSAIEVVVVSSDSVACDSGAWVSVLVELAEHPAITSVAPNNADRTNDRLTNCIKLKANSTSTGYA